MRPTKRVSVTAEEDTEIAYCEISSNRHDQWICIALMLAVFVAYAPAYRAGFVSLDDRTYLTANPHIQTGLTRAGIVWAFTTNTLANWHPLTWLSYLLDFQLFGLNPAPYHIENVLFHAVNAVLLLFVLQAMTGALWRSALVAALFALHPLHVESVAWVSERKDVLSTFFWLLTMAAYLKYTFRPSAAQYALVVIAFALGLMAKPMLVTLPFVLLLLDYWPLKRLALPNRLCAAWLRTQWPLLREKLPLLGVAAASCIITVFVQHQGKATASTAMFTMPMRLANAPYACVKYILKTVYPRYLAVPYTHPGNTLSPWQAGALAVLLLLVTLALLRYAASRHPYAVVGWLWYLLTLVPVIGLIQVGGQGMADRYTYVPLIGLFVMLAWGLGELAVRRTHLKAGIVAASGIALVILAALTYIQTGYWRNSVTLFEHTLSVDPNNIVARCNLGSALMDEGRYDEAAFHFGKAVEVNHNDTESLNDLGVALLLGGNAARAAEVFAEVLRQTPDDPTVYCNLGAAFLQQGERARATENLHRALQIDPNCENAKKALDMMGEAPNSAPQK